MSTALLDQWGDSSPDPRQWRLMSKTQRCNMVENILLEHQRFNELLERIDYCSRFGGEIETKNPPCLAILGHTGAGKTTLLDTWLAKAPLRGMETPEGSIIPYLYVLVPSSPKKKGAVAAFLRALHDPNPSRGTEWDMILRVHRLMKKCQVRMVFVDEFQHLVDKDTQKVVHAVADFIRMESKSSGDNQRVPHTYARYRCCVAVRSFKFAGRRNGLSLLLRQRRLPGMDYGNCTRSSLSGDRYRV